MSFSTLETTFSPLKIVFPKSSEVAVLPTTKDTLEALLADTQAVCEKACQEAYQAAIQSIRLQAHEYIIRMLEQATLARHRLFGASSEQLSAQSRLFDEAEVLAQLNPEAQDQAIIAPAPPASAEDGTLTQPVKPAQPVARGKRRPLPAELPRVDVIHDVPVAERTCGCGTPMVEIGEDVSEQIDIVPMQVRVIRNIRKRYGCPASVHVSMTSYRDGVAVRIGQVM